MFFVLSLHLCLLGVLLIDVCEGVGNTGDPEGVLQGGFAAIRAVSPMGWNVPSRRDDSSPSSVSPSHDQWTSLPREHSSISFGSQSYSSELSGSLEGDSRPFEEGSSPKRPPVPPPRNLHATSVSMDGSPPSQASPRWNRNRLGSAGGLHTLLFRVP